MPAAPTSLWGLHCAMRSIWQQWLQANGSCIAGIWRPADLWVTSLRSGSEDCFSFCCHILSASLGAFAVSLKAQMGLKICVGLWTRRMSTSGVVAPSWMLCPFSPPSRGGWRWQPCAGGNPCRDTLNTGYTQRHTLLAPNVTRH